MLGLSVVVAVMGLSAGSAAVVIGAMLLAPLMTPVMGAAAALAMALPRHLSRSLAVVGVASVGSVWLAYLLALLVPDTSLSTEVLARTSPDLRDLMVALAAGAAGAYATVRPDVSSSLPGVAVAVALVPPLATIGMTIEAGRGDLAGGAALLYLANLLAIVLIGTMVFVATGFVPRSRLARKGFHVAGSGVVVAMATVAVAVPLAVASIAAANDGQDRAKLYEAARSWLEGTGDDLDEVRMIEADVVRVKISGPNPPPPTEDLERAIDQILGAAATVEVRWTQTHDPRKPLGSDAAQAGETAVREVVDDWLAGAATGTYEVVDFEVTDDLIRVDLVSAEPPPAIDDLYARLRERLDVVTPVEVNWTRRTTLRSSAAAEAETSSVDRVLRELRVAAQDWARAFDGYLVDDVTFDGDRVTVELLGPDAVDVTTLEQHLRFIAGGDIEVRIWLTRRQALTGG